MGNVFLLALAAAVYPTLLAGVIVILSRPNPVRLLLGFLAGGMAVSVIAGVVIVTSLRGSHAVVPSNHATRPAIDIAAGVVSLGVAVALLRGRFSRVAEWRERRRTKERGPSWTDRALGRGSTLVAFGVGVLLNLPGVWYLAALADIAAAELEPAEELLLILGFNVVMFALVEIPLVFYLVDAERARKFVELASGWVHSHARQAAATVAAVVGVWLVAKGIAGAVS
ncbi:MAG TPA: GAP family protein [Thermoleophilaceae bacterium]